MDTKVPLSTTMYLFPVQNSKPGGWSTERPACGTYMYAISYCARHNLGVPAIPYTWITTIPYTVLSTQNMHATHTMHAPVVQQVQ